MKNGQKVIGRVIRVKDTPSPKRGLYSTSFGFETQIDGPYGKQIIFESVIGVMLTEKKPHDLAVGDMVNLTIDGDVRVSTYINQQGEEATSRTLNVIFGGKAVPAASPVGKAKKVAA